MLEKWVYSCYYKTKLKRYETHGRVNKTMWQSQKAESISLRALSHNLKISITKKVKNFIKTSWQLDKNVIWYEHQKEVNKLKKNFATSIDTDISDEFKKTCDDYGLKMNIVLEALMKDFSNGNYTIKLKKNDISIERED